MSDKGAIAKDITAMYGFAGSITNHPGHGMLGALDIGNYFAFRLEDRLNKDGTLSGTVYAAGNPVPNCRVYIMWRENMKVIGTTFTDANGAWSYHGLDPSLASHYTVIAKDPAGGTQYNDVMFSLVQPQVV